MSPVYRRSGGSEKPETQKRFDASVLVYVSGGTARFTIVDSGGTVDFQSLILAF